MRELFFGNNTYSFPDKWEELTREQYLMLVEAIMDFQAGKTNASGCRATWFCKMAGIDTKKRDNDNDVFWENIYRASNLFDFFLEIEYLDPETLETKSLKHLPSDLRKKLRKFPPSDLEDIPEFRWASKLKYKYVIDAIFGRNLLPELTINGRHYPGYRFEITGNLLTTSLTARTFIDATMAYNEYVKDSNPVHLDMLIQVLYFQNKPEFIRKVINSIPERVKFAVLLNFQAILAFIMNKTRYSIIWRKTDPETKQEDKLNVGLADAIYSLEKSGYENIENDNLIKYLDLLLKNIIDTVIMLNENEVNIAEIADRTNLTIQQIQKII